MNSIPFKFSIIIPTRERSETLYWAIKTCVAQDYDNLEIIVSDNFSQDNTKDVVCSFDDKRIKYINTGTRVSMTENWEFGLTHATGDYISFIGDDDGFSIGSISFCNDFLKLNKTDALVWKKASYYWPNFPSKILSDTLEIDDAFVLEEVNAKKRLEEILFFEKYKDHPLPTNFLPCIYNSFISKRVIDLAKEKQHGFFFDSRCPDIYSSILLTFFIDKYYYTTKPITINGASARSNGAGSLDIVMGKPNKEAELFAKESAQYVHSKLILTNVSNFPFIVMEGYLFVCDNLNIDYTFFDLASFSNAAINYTKKFHPTSISKTIESIELTYRANNIPFIQNFKVEPVRRQMRLMSIFRLILYMNKALHLKYLQVIRKKKLFVISGKYPNVYGASLYIKNKIPF